MLMLRIPVAQGAVGRSLMGTRPIEMQDILVEDAPLVRIAHHQQVLQEFVADAAQYPLADHICPWCLDRRPQDLDA